MQKAVFDQTPDNGPSKEEEKKRIERNRALRKHGCFSTEQEEITVVQLDHFE